MRKLKWIIPFFLIIISASSTVAQQCLSIVTAALEQAGNECSLTERNQVCYGYINVNALPSVNPNNFSFDVQGDIVPVEQVAALELSPFDEDTGEWGVVIARLQAQLPDTLPGQNVTIVFFGGVSMLNDGIDASGIQAFRFETGIGAGRCFGLAPDGIIIDTPDEASFLTFDINGVEVTLGSKAFLQTVPNAAGSDESMLRIGMIEGLGFITAEGQTTRISNGQQTTIPLDTNLEAKGAPSPPSDFEIGSLASMSAFVGSLEFNNSGTGNEPPSIETAPPPIETEAVSIPCTISTDRGFSAALRVGPGLNRTHRAWLAANREVTVTGISDDGEWWQLDKFEAFPSGADLVLELWVRVDEVTARGDCDSIGATDAPPIIAPPQPQRPSPTPSEGGGIPPIVVTEETQEPIVTYWTEDVSTSHFETCTNINWYIEFVSAVHLVGDGAGLVPLSGITGSYQVCPSITTTYYIRVTYPDGFQEDFPVTVLRNY
ncbi:MAG: hypothetical protein Q9P01_03110 [Anaerolineae bacterium]|nr:hypothetical protein [Anaerolineae bacterium]MDQ7033843.1 hypothetical protein [Anaerolineae bacterium]